MRMTIKIEYDDNKEMFLENDISLGKIFGTICTNLKIIEISTYESIRYYINNVVLEYHELRHNYALNNIKVVT